VKITIENDNHLTVKYHGRNVGTLAISQNKKVAFQYDDEWIESGFSISPFSLPLKKQVFVPHNYHFNGLFGVFADSLPDAWGNLLLDRMLRIRGQDPGSINMLDRLAIVGNAGMGALEYVPSRNYRSDIKYESLDEVADICRRILESEDVDNLDEIYSLTGSSGGDRPKILTEYEGENWIIKFSAHTDSDNIGMNEYVYSKQAKSVGIDMEETRLFPSESCEGYFGTRRFDVSGGAKRHVLTAAALLELDYRQLCMDYSELMKLTRILTRENKADIENMFLRMCFNVVMHNMDDHAKNFSFIYDEVTDGWRLAPAYDLTYSNTYFGEHTTSVNGNGKNPTADDMLAVGMGAGLKKKWCVEQIDRISLL